MSWISQIFDGARRTASNVAGGLNPVAGGLLSPYVPQVTLLGGNQGKSAGLNGGVADQVYESNMAELAQLRSDIDRADIAPGIKEEFQKRIANIPYDIDGVRGDFARAKNNEGTYGTRNRNYQSQKIFMNRPGAVQLFASSTSRLNAQNGTISANSQNSLLVPKG